MQCVVLILYRSFGTASVERILHSEVLDRSLALNISIVFILKCWILLFHVLLLLFELKRIYCSCVS